MVCEICGGIGLVPSEGQLSRPCDCQAEIRRRLRLARLGIPPAFAGATLANFQPCGHTRQALMMAQRYVAEFIPGQTKTGLLFSGSTGTGKTHLALGMVRELAETKGVLGCFYDVNQLLDRLRMATFDNDAPETREQIMRPVWAAELLVLDELGAMRSNDWVFETMQSLLGRLYNEQKPVIITTNLLNQAFDPKATQPTLGERIGERMYSRLQQMCYGVDMTGPDWRRRK